MAWALWLSGPAAATALVAVWVWWRARPRRRPSFTRGMRQHDEYLAALTVPVRGTARTPPAPVRD
ncbi:MAG: hypothetical protein M3N95_05910 [Actinomycetota bacterium]|nr:hypothetical protein [Actinomycetota bacterium]